MPQSKWGYYLPCFRSPKWEESGKYLQTPLESSSLGWQHRRPLKLTSSHRHTKSTAIYGIIPPERNPEAGLATPTHWVNEKKCTSKWVGEAETQLTINPTTGAAIHNQERIHRPNLPSNEWRVWTLYLAYQLLRSAFEIWAPQTPSFESQRGLLHKIHKAK